MLDLAAESYLLAAVTVAILAQRRVRLNCSKCRQPYTPTEDEIDMLKLNEGEMAGAKFAKGAGCAECKGTGYKGRIGVFELIMGTPELRAAIAKNADFPTMQEVARRQGYRTMLEDGKHKIFQGWTTPDEVIKAVYTQSMD
jgi:type II secretory ATPase GspE/PulE/Tfp pilus assembly ATPase PilB-like protein